RRSSRHHPGPRRRAVLSALSRSVRSARRPSRLASPRVRPSSATSRPPRSVVRRGCRSRCRSYACSLSVHLAKERPSMRATTLWQRITSNFRDPDMRARVLALVGGKAIGLILLLTAMKIYLAPALFAQTPAPSGPSPEVNAINTSWTLIAAFLVFGMQVGFVMLEAGFARSRESINILVEGIVDTCICGVTFWAWGFAFMFMDGTPFIGTHGFFLKGLPETYLTTGVPLLAYWVFQFAFADTCSTITSGAMVGRCGFIGDILYSIGVT